MRYALIEQSTGRVVNVVVIDDGDGSQTPAGFEIIQSDIANIGDTWNGTAFTPPAQS